MGYKDYGDFWNYRYRDLGDYADCFFSIAKGTFGTIWTIVTDTFEITGTIVMRSIGTIVNSYRDFRASSPTGPTTTTTTQDIPPLPAHPTHEKNTA